VEALRGLIAAEAAIPTIGSDATNPLDDPFLLMNLWPRNTGLPMVVWVAESGGMPPPVLMKVAQVHGDHRGFDDLAVVAVHPSLEVRSGLLSDADLGALRRWVDLNRDIILDYWNENIDSGEFVERMKRLSENP
jgi:hypothetical protein